MPGDATPGSFEGTLGWAGGWMGSFSYALADGPEAGLGLASDGGLARAGSVLVVGLGDAAAGDRGVGAHLLQVLAQLDWPANVVFSPADGLAAHQPDRFHRVILLDSLDGDECPGSLYRADPENILAAGPGLSPLLSPNLRNRMDIFGVQPAPKASDGLSREILAALPVLLPYLRAVILRAASAASGAN